MFMHRQKFKASYDREGDVLTLCSDKVGVQESVEVAEELIIDIDKNKRIINLELLDAYKFLHTLNKKISKEMLKQLEEAELQFKNYRNYWIISVAFEYQNQKIEEKLPAFAKADFQSPLVASAESVAQTI
jgi:uncharacterized protein YuzE